MKAKVVAASMEPVPEYGHYLISVFLMVHKFGVRTFPTKVCYYSTDSKLWDDVSDMETEVERSLYILEKEGYTIERKVEDFLDAGYEQ